jgi:hypothetical protein
MGVQKVKVSHESSETEFGLQNHYGIIFIDQNPYIIELNNGILSQNSTNPKKNPHQNDENKKAFQKKKPNFFIV